MICTSIGNVDPGECRRRLRDLSFAEVRLDTMDVDGTDVQAIFSMPLKLVATCRPGRYGDEERLDLLAAAIGAGAAYVDIESDTPEKLRETIVDHAARHGSKVIISYHDYEKTPDPGSLRKIVARAFLSGGHLAKIACTVDGPADSLRLLDLLSLKRHSGKVIVIGMGTKGRIVRAASPLLGAPFTYAAYGEEPLAPGQMSTQRLKEILELISHE